MKIRKKLCAILGVKGVLSLSSLVITALALVAYTATVTMTPTVQFTNGATSATWTVYVNDVNEIRSLPGSGAPAGSAEPTFNAGDSSTYAFRVVTDADKVCAVKIDLTSAVNGSKFSNFNITTRFWTGAAWADETIYDAATGSTVKSYIDGLSAGDAGYIHQDVSTTRYYLIRVNYSYDLVDETAQVTVTFQYTPTPQDSF